MKRMIKPPKKVSTNGFISFVFRLLRIETENNGSTTRNQSQLAKLLATEDLVVEHKKVETASFNVEVEYYSTHGDKQQRCMTCCKS